jgi:hypothetical protein
VHFSSDEAGIDVPWIQDGGAVGLMEKIMMYRHAGRLAQGRVSHA